MHHHPGPLPPLVQPAIRALVEQLASDDMHRQTVQRAAGCEHLPAPEVRRERDDSPAARQRRLDVGAPLDDREATAPLPIQLPEIQKIDEVAPRRSEHLTHQRFPFGRRSLVAECELEVRSDPALRRTIDVAREIPAGIEPPEAKPSEGVIVYKTDWCGVCKKLTAYLDRKGVEYVAKDIEKDPAAAGELQAKAKAKGIQTGSVPVIDVGGELMVGFDRARLEKLL